MGRYINTNYFKKIQNIYFVIIASFAILSYIARITARKIGIKLAGSWS